MSEPVLMSEPVAGPALTVSHLDVTYRVRERDRLALKDVSFTIERGPNSRGTVIDARIPLRRGAPS